MTRFASVLVSLTTLLALGNGNACAQGRELFDAVYEKLTDSYYDEAFRETKLPGLASRYRDKAYAANTLAEARAITQAFLSNVPASHLGLLSETGYQRLVAELYGRRHWTYGFELIQLDGKYYAHNVLEGGPANLAGLKRGDRVSLINGHLPEDADEVDARTDDAAHPDPPVHGLHASRESRLRLEIERRPGEFLGLAVAAGHYSAFEAAKASREVIEVEGHRIAHIHFWYIHISGLQRLLKQSLSREFADCDALVLDLRGRGGNGAVLDGLVEILKRWDRPVVALINGHSRSAKEVLAYELKQSGTALLVGERTAGAVIPASFAKVGHETRLMYPGFQLGEHTERLEGTGVAPDVTVEEVGPYSAGRDPILRRGLEQASSLVVAKSRTRR